MKYKLLKKIEGMDWEVGEVLESPRYNSSLVTGEKGKFLSEVDLHNLLLNGTIEKVIKENKRWRARRGELYFSILLEENTGVTIKAKMEHGEKNDDFNWRTGNYMGHDEAQAVADKIKQLLKESHAIYN